MQELLWLNARVRMEWIKFDLNRKNGKKSILMDFTGIIIRLLSERLTSEKRTTKLL